MSNPDDIPQYYNAPTILVLLASPPILLSDNTPQESWEVDREVWKTYNGLDWFIKQELEPNMPHNGKSSLTRWLKEVDGGWECHAPLEHESIWCSHGPFKRLDRALGHLRKHLGLEPFPCGGGCGKGECNRRFHSIEKLSTHRKGQDYRDCELCGEPELRQNMARHKTTYCTNRASQTDEAT